MKKSSITLLLLITTFIFSWGQNESKVNKINDGMPNRISMNVTVAKQTQGASFGEKVQAGIDDAGCVVLFPNKQSFRVNSVGTKITELGQAETAKVNAGLHAAGGALAQGAALVGGALPGGAIISAKLTKADSQRTVWEANNCGNEFLFPSKVPDGEYQLLLNLRTGLKDTLKTQVRFGILVEGGRYKVVSVST